MEIAYSKKTENILNQIEIPYSHEKWKYSKQKLRIISSQYKETNHNLQIMQIKQISKHGKKAMEVIINKAINTTKAIAKHHWNVKHETSKHETCTIQETKIEFDVERI